MTLASSERLLNSSIRSPPPTFCHGRKLDAIRTFLTPNLVSGLRELAPSTEQRQRRRDMRVRDRGQRPSRRLRYMMEREAQGSTGKIPSRTPGAASGRPATPTSQSTRPSAGRTPSGYRAVRPPRRGNILRFLRPCHDGVGQPPSAANPVYGCKRPYSWSV